MLDALMSILGSPVWTRFELWLSARRQAFGWCSNRFNSLRFVEYVCVEPDLDVGMLLGRWSHEWKELCQLDTPSAPE
jgi:hypothetical protein